MYYRMRIVIFAGCLCLVAAAQSAPEHSFDETQSTAGSGGYWKEWPPGPPRSSVPAWAAPGMFSFSRWDGGPVETAKGLLSGWPGLNPPIPDYVYVTTNWYDPSTVRFLREAHISLVWVTFSAGFSIPTEREQRDLVRNYIAECHRYGIHVMAYESAANLFWEDMYQNVPQSKSWIRYGKDGKPDPYGAGRYSRMGRVTRYMANLSNPEWRAYLMQRLDEAIDAGADGIIYDNIMGTDSNAVTADLFQGVMRHALERKRDFLVMVNFPQDKYILNRLLNSMTTEDGGEAGIFSEDHLANLRLSPAERKMLLPVEGGLLVNHGGLFRTYENLTEGWKPAMIESNHREVGNRFTDYMSPERQQLAIAEPMMFGVVNEEYVELRFAHDLWRGVPAAMAAWRAIGQYNAFFEENRAYYRGARSRATLAVVLDNRSKGQELMNALSARNVLYNVLYEQQLTPELLKPYAAVALLTAQTVRDGALAALKDYVQGGGRLFAAEDAATMDEAGDRRERPAWFEGRLGAGEAVYWPKMPGIDKLAAALKAADRPSPVRVEAPAGVLYNVTEQPQSGRMMVHLLNYLPHPVGNVVVTVAGRHDAVSVLSPDEPAPQPSISGVGTDGGVRVELPSLRIYSVVVLGSEN